MSTTAGSGSGSADDGPDGTDQPAAPGSISQSSPLNWRNQTVVSFGIAHVLNERTTLRAGFNYGRNPVPIQTMSPLLASIGERHFTAGASYRMSNGWELGGGLEYALIRQITQEHAPDRSETQHSYYRSLQRRQPTRMFDRAATILSISDRTLRPSVDWVPQMGSATGPNDNDLGWFGDMIPQMNHRHIVPMMHGFIARLPLWLA